MAKPRITIVGCGFVGTALGLALRNHLKDVEIIGHDKNSANTQRAEKMKAIDRSIWNLPASVENAQVIILAVPQDAIEPTLRAISPDIIPGAIVTDTSTLKSPLGPVVEKYVPANASYISSDIVFDPERAPAGMDVEKVTSEIFKRAAWTLTPMGAASRESIDSFAGLASELGATPIFMDAVEHDGLRLAVDTIPAAVSSALLMATTGDTAWRERQWLAGSAFGAATANVSNTHPEEIAAALLSQRDATTHWLNQVMLQLMAIREAVNTGNAEQLKTLLSTAQERRDKWLNDWYRGRDEGRAQVEQKRPSLLSAFVGTKLASRLSDAAIDKDKQKKRG
jgi:prephenate dehydrogenase